MFVICISFYKPRLHAINLGPLNPKYILIANIGRAGVHVYCIFCSYFVHIVAK